MNEQDQLYDILLHQAGLDDAAVEKAGNTIKAGDTDGPIPLSLAQRRLWFLQLLDGVSSHYNNGFGLRLTGPLDLALLEHALLVLVERHGALRTVVVPSENDGEEPLQRLCKADPVRLVVREAGNEADALKLAGELAAEPFDLAVDKPIRFHLLRLDVQDHLLVAVIHHICSDGWSLSVLLEEFGKAFCGESLEPLPVSYADYAVWEQSQTARHTSGVNYWTNKLQGIPSRLELPLDRILPERQRYGGAHLDLGFSSDLVRCLTNLAVEEGATLQMALLSGFSALLCSYAGQNEMVMGLPTANRSRPELKGLVGLFVNTVALRLHCQPAATFREYLRTVAAECLQGLNYADTPFEMVVEALSPERSLRHAPVFQIMFAFQSIPPRAPHLPGMGCKYVQVNPPASPYELFLSLEQNEQGGVSGRLVYDSYLFKSVTAVRLLENWLCFLECVTDCPDKPLGELNWLAPAQRKLVLDRWQGPTIQHDEQSTLATLLAERVQRDSDKVALIDVDGRQLSLGQVWQQGVNMAWTLQSAGLRNKAPVGLFLPRSADLAVGMAASLLAGSPWLCLDPALPRQRIEFMLQDAGISHLITVPELAESIAMTGAHILGMADSEVAPDSFTPPGLKRRPDNAAYLLYTSGSTGRPKGVVGLHRGMVCRLNWGWNCFPYREDELCCLKTAPAFADWIAEVMSPLLGGVPSAVLGSEEVREPERLLSRLARLGVTRLLLVPSLLRMMLEQAPDLGRQLERLYHWTVSGEPLPGDLLNRFRQAVPAGILLNLYGTSEVSADATWEVFAPLGNGSSSPPSTGIVPIGRPLPGARTYILDNRGCPVPPGVAGDLFVAGPYLARGYLGQAEATAAVFVKDPFFCSGKGAESEERMFRTGDRARFRADGSLDYLGRNDFVITIHGLRIDPGEIEAHLCTHPAIRQAAIKLHEETPNQGYIVAFLELRHSGESVAKPTAEEIRKYLVERLPSTMIPHRFLVLANLPLLASGKLDRLGLPLPDDCELLPGGRGSVSPGRPAEILIADQWRAVLKRPPRSMGESFFTAGGHSLMAMRLADHIAKAAGVVFPVHLIFESPTVARLADILEKVIEEGGSEQELVPVEILRHVEHPPISPSQMRFWILNRLDATGAYLMVGALRVSGPVNYAALEDTLYWLVERHPGLRTVYGSRGGRPWLTVRSAWEMDFSIEDLRSVPETDREKTCNGRLASLARTVFDLDTVPPFRLRLLKLSDEKCYLVLVMHHILIDGWSSLILLEELGQGYRSFAAGGKPEIDAPVPTCFDAGVWLQTRLDNGTLEASLEYWRGLLAGLPPEAHLITDRSRPAIRDSSGSTYRFTVTPAVADGLRTFTAVNGISEYIGLLSAFVLLLSRHTEADELIFGIVSANRPHRDLQRIVSLFSNTLPLRLQLGRTQTGAELLSLVDKAVREAMRHEEPPFHLIVEQAGVQRDMSRTPLFQTLFVFQNDPFRADLEGLEVETIPLSGERAPNDLTFEIQPSPNGGYQGAAIYATALWEESSIARLVEHFMHLCSLLASARVMDMKWRDYPLASPDEMAAVYKLSSGKTGKVPDKPVHELILEWSHRDRNKPAVVGPSGVLSRGALCRLAGGVAQRLQTSKTWPRGDTEEQLLAAICLPTGPDYVAAWLGVLLSGAAVLPLDPGWPLQRLQEVLDRAAPVALIGTPAVLGKIHLSEKTVNLDMGRIRPLDEIPSAGVSDMDTLSYVVFTSGSTAEPKGVAVAHGAFANLAWTQGELYGVDESTRALLAVAPAFDVAMGELATILCAGGTVVTASPEVLIPGRDLVELLKNERVTHLSMTGSALAAMPGDAADVLDLLSTVISGGEVLAPAIATRWAKGRRLFNAYGPSEATVCALAGEYCGPNVLGRPLSGVQALVLDEIGNLQPFGVPGELCLAGRGLARGYLGRPDLTESAFISHQKAVGGRLYRTGDRAWLAEDGRFHFLGRRDEQVKIRGFRVEPAEVLKCLESLSGVSCATVLPRESGGEMSLVAFVTPEETVNDQHQWLDDLRDHLRDFLPAPLIPARLLMISTMPLTANGKIDAAALSAFDEEQSMDESVRSTHPGSHVQKIVEDVWREVLGCKVGENINFFDAGGHSLLLARMQALLEERLERRISMVDLFRDPTIAGLARRLTVGESPVAESRKGVIKGGKSGDIAIIGMACRYPGAPNLSAYWDVVREGRETLTTYSREELSAAGVSGAVMDDPDFVPVQGFVEDIDLFDAHFFGLSPTDAELLDPQQRVFLECAYHALEHAGHKSTEESQHIAVFAGSGMNEYLEGLFPEGLALSAEAFGAITGNDKDFLASRTAYLLNLTGPAVNVQTACSTSLVAVALACETLRQGRARLALAGGVSLPLRPRGYLAREGLIFSKDGHCRAFDALATGTVAGGGCGVVTLRPLEDAISEGDVIYAVIRGVAINNDGSLKAGFTAPGVDGQTDVIRAALADSGVEPSTIGYVETHGTGTRLGDPIEVAALNRAYGVLPGEAVITLGSVKANMGHADTAAGVAGLIKGALCLWHETLPPTPHFQSPNLEIDFKLTPFRICVSPEAWQKSDQPRRAGVSSFGIGGTNAHIILEEGGHPGKMPAEVTPYPFARERYWRESVPAEPSVKQSADPQKWFYVPGWQRLIAPALLADRQVPGRWLILADSEDDAKQLSLGRALAAEVERNGGQAILVLPGTGYEQEGDCYRLRPESREDFEQLFTDLKAQNLFPEAAAHLWGIDAGDTVEDLDASRGGLDMACCSFLWLARAMGLDPAPCRLFLVTRGLMPVHGTEQGAILPALAMGAARVIPYEQENVTVRLLDLDDNTAGVGSAELARQLLHEALCGREPEVALRGPQRYAPVMSPYRSAPESLDTLPFGRGGFWWITGGLGGVGRAVARRLAVDHGEKLLLTSRTSLPSREHWLELSNEQSELGRGLRLVLDLERQGAKILFLTADAADNEQTEHALAVAKQQFGRLSGVIHTAGLVDEGGVLRRRHRNDILSVLAPKVTGSLLLRKIVRRERVPLVLFSSLGNLLPSTKFAQIAYAAANEFLDLLADRETEARLLTINWDDWSEAGMSVRASENWRERHNLGTDDAARPGLSNDEGWEALCRAFASGLPRLAVSVRDLYQLMDDKRMTACSVAETLVVEHNRPDLSTSFESPLPGRESQLAAIWSDVLGVSGVGALDDFFELGGHSLLSTRVAVLVKQRLGLTLPVNAIFDTPVLRDMAAGLATGITFYSSGADNTGSGTNKPGSIEDMEDYVF